MCRVCGLIEHAMAEVRSVGGLAPQHDAMRDAIGAAYITGFAAGFNIRTETTMEMFCPMHAEAMKNALRLAGAIEHGVTKGGSA